MVFILKEEETEDDEEATTDDDFVERRVSYQAGERAAERCAKLVSGPGDMACASA